MKRRILSLLLGLSLCFSLLPAALAEEGKTYEEAVAELRGSAHYNPNSEQAYETEDCTVFVYDQGGHLRAPQGRIAIIYKSGSLPGEGTRIDNDCPYPLMLLRGPDRLDISEDQRTLTYAYVLEEDEESASLKAGIYTYTVDLPSGVTTPSYAPFTGEGLVEVLTHGRVYPTEKELEGPLGWAILRWSGSPVGSNRDYQLYLIRREGEPLAQRLLLPSTVIWEDYAHVPTDRGPDYMAFSEDGSTLTYLYRFEEALSRDGTVYHEAGTYTYTVDVPSGELSVEHSDALPSQGGGFADVPAGSWFEVGVNLCAEKGVMIGTGSFTFSPKRELSQAECLTLAFRLYDLMRGEEHVIEAAPGEGKLVLTLADGTVLEGYGPGHGEEDCVFGWWFSPMGTRQAVYAMVPGWSGWSDEDIKAGLRAQDAWLGAHPEVRGHGVPAALTLDGVTYQGTTDCFMPVQPFVFTFNPEPERTEEVNAILHEAVYRKGTPGHWWDDTVYTIEKRGLEDIFDPADFTDGPASRGFFARLLAAACGGSLEKINTVETIPDLPREKDSTTADQYREAAYQLYEAGVLTGVDQAGTFAAGNTLTRAEAAVMVARVLDPALRVRTAAPADSACAAALEDMRRGFGYHNERLFEADICTVVVNDYGGMMRAQKGCITVIYKPGSAKGDGFLLKPPHPGNEYSPLLSRNPDHMGLSEDKKSFTYSYHFDEPLEYEGQIIRAAGDFTYTVDLATGEVTEDIPEIPEEVNTYEASLSRLLADSAADGYVVEKTIEAPLCTLIFHYFPAQDGTRSYSLDLVYKTDVDADVSGSIRHTPEGAVKNVRLPVTHDDGSGLSGGQPVFYTARMPDAMSLSEDGNTFTLTYNECHYGSPYTQTIDLTTALYEGK